jgi:hypothetical protein
MGSNGKLILVIWVFTLQAVFEELIKLVNWGSTVHTFSKYLFAPDIHLL